MRQLRTAEHRRADFLPPRTEPDPTLYTNIMESMRAPGVILPRQMRPARLCKLTCQPGCRFCISHARWSVKRATWTPDRACSCVAHRLYVAVDDAHAVEAPQGHQDLLHQRLHHRRVPRLLAGRTAGTAARCSGVTGVHLAGQAAGGPRPAVGMDGTDRCVNSRQPLVDILTEGRHLLNRGRLRRRCFCSQRWNEPQRGACRSLVLQKCKRATPARNPHLSAKCIWSCRAPALLWLLADSASRRRASAQPKTGSLQPLKQTVTARTVSDC